MNTNEEQNRAKQNAMKKSNFEILFKDSAEYFAVSNAKMFTEGPYTRFVCFNEDNTFSHNEFYPTNDIHRIKAYAMTK